MCECVKARALKFAAIDALSQPLRPFLVCPAFAFCRCGYTRDGELNEPRISHPRRRSLDLIWSKFVVPENIKRARGGRRDNRSRRFQRQVAAICDTSDTYFRN